MDFLRFGLKMIPMNVANPRKGIQSAGGAAYWAMDGQSVSYDSIFFSTWGVLVGSLLIATPVICFKIQDHVSIEQDLKFSDETIEDVIVGPDAKRIDAES